MILIRKKMLVLLALPSVLFAMTVLILMNVRIDTRVVIDVTVDGVSFTVAGTSETHTPVLNQVGFYSVTISNFKEIRFKTEKLEVADEQMYVFSSDRHPKSAWKSIDFTQDVVLTPEDETLPAVVTFESTVTDPKTTGTVDRLWAGHDTNVKIKTRNDSANDITIEVNGNKSSTVLYFQKQFLVITRNTRLSGIKNEHDQRGSFTYRAKISEADPNVEVESQPKSLALDFTIPSDKMTHLFSAGIIKVSDIEFIRQGLRGEPTTTLVKDGEITYPDHPKIKKVSFKSTDFVVLRQLEDFYVEKVSVFQEFKGIRFLLSGFAGYIKTGTPNYLNDHRVTLFAVLWNNPYLIVLFTIIAWIFPTTVGFFKLCREIKNGSF